MTKASIKEAAERLEVWPESHWLGFALRPTVRRRIHKGELSAVQEETPQGFVWVVELPDGVDEVQAESTGDGYRELVEVLRREMDSKDVELEARRREVQELHVLLQQAQAALPAPKENHRSWWQFWKG